ncbi:hypothetical protein TREMEDRAFT_73988 [Tremella mesenterica DSM 1558]|uniref:uncharacterized protein n=1 Tax=Tremella mesenterica (strain ATCC 24925 / CBS 8224 / DSM 1558 / NBRC 9311 / NRRL Y-6157 / RJB 2259-6 / UBC 559-6) TaxID=578456 RepID=UPI0003F49AC9|nr:uncharacterized protein TREMEDRAFT_73988 [Tremella mesenterica DSM 1558]EIW68988.1 hypothetical protein TREMEDRAFT_73988 [Tremella mesenterica DSM 1558]
MSVPLPSPSLISAPPRAIPRSRPDKLDLTESSSPTTTTPGGTSFRRPVRNIGFKSPSPNGNNHSGEVDGQGQGVGGETDNWRDRKTRGPERTVGGFEKRQTVVSPTEKNGGKESPVGDTKAEALSHVPCRFFKAGTCTAGASCPFSHDGGGTKEVCQWFLKGNCKFGHKCALLHLHPGEPLSMDRRNKKASQREAREKAEGKPSTPSTQAAPETPAPQHHDTIRTAVPVPIKSALSSSLQSPPPHRLPSSPLREPFGPPSGIQAGSPGFGRFASSPNRAGITPPSLGLKSPAVLQLRPSSAVPSPLRPPVTAAPGFSSSFSQPRLTPDRPIPLSASFADGSSRRNIWSPSQEPSNELLSPARVLPPARAVPKHMRAEDEERGEEFLPASLEDLLTPSELARRQNRRDSQGSFPGSPVGIGHVPYFGERLAQSAGPTMDPGFLRSLWNDTGVDARRGSPLSPADREQERDREDVFNFGPATAQPAPRQSLLSQQRGPTSPQRFITTPVLSSPQGLEAPYLRTPPLPSSPSAKALQEHAPGQSLPGGLAGALSRLHMTGRPSGLADTGVLIPKTGDSSEEITPPGGTVPLPGNGRREGRDERDEGVFLMDG